MPSTYGLRQAPLSVGRRKSAGLPGPNAAIAATAPVTYAAALFRNETPRMITPLDPAVAQKLKDAFLALDYGNPEHKAILDLQRTKKFIPTKAENYGMIEDAARSAGLIRDAK